VCSVVKGRAAAAAAAAAAADGGRLNFTPSRGATLSHGRLTARQAGAPRLIKRHVDL